MSVSATIRGLFEMARPMNAFGAGLLTFIGAFVAGGGVGDFVPITLAILATVLATAGGNSINDYFDRDIDAINRPDRPIPRGSVPPRLAIIHGGILLGIAVLMAIQLPPVAILIAAVNLLMLVTYTSLFKGLPGVGNAVVSILSGSTFLFGGAAIGHIGPAGVLFILAALATFSREVIKDVEDIVGDLEEGLTTLPIYVGERRALVVAFACLLVAVAASPLPYVTGTFGWAYLAVVTPANATMLWASARAFRDPSEGQRWLKRGMYLAALAFVVGRVTAVGPL